MTRPTQLTDEVVINYIRESTRAQNASTYEFVKPSHGGMDGDGVRKLRETVPVGATFKGGFIDRGLAIEFHPLQSLDSQCRTWLGLPKRGLTEEARVAAVKNIVICLMSCLVFAFGVSALVMQKTHPRTDASIDERKSASTSVQAVKPASPFSLGARTIKVIDNTHSEKYVPGRDD